MLWQRETQRGKTEVSARTGLWQWTAWFQKLLLSLAGSHRNLWRTTPASSTINWKSCQRRKAWASKGVNLGMCLLQNARSCSPAWGQCSQPLEHPIRPGINHNSKWPHSPTEVILPLSTQLSKTWWKPYHSLFSSSFWTWCLHSRSFTPEKDCNVTKVISDMELLPLIMIP